MNEVIVVNGYAEQTHGWGTAAFKTPSGKRPFTRRQKKVLIISDEEFEKMPRHVALYQRDLNAAAFYDQSLSGSPLPANELHHGNPFGYWCSHVDYVASHIPHGWSPKEMVLELPSDGVIVVDSRVEYIDGVAVTIFVEEHE